MMNVNGVEYPTKLPIRIQQPTTKISCTLTDWKIENLRGHNAIYGLLNSRQCTKQKDALSFIFGIKLSLTSTDGYRMVLIKYERNNCF